MPVVWKKVCRKPIQPTENVFGEMQVGLAEDSFEESGQIDKTCLAVVSGLDKGLPGRRKGALGYFFVGLRGFMARIRSILKCRSA